MSILFFCELAAIMIVLSFYNKFYSTKFVVDCNIGFESLGGTISNRGDFRIFIASLLLLFEGYLPFFEPFD
jgi:hypothetical protein